MITARRTRTDEVVLLLVGLAVVAYFCSTAVLGLDYSSDAQPAIEALAHGRFGDVLHSPPSMGPVSIVLRTPVVAAADALSAGNLATYRLGALACLIPVVIVALMVTRAREARRQPFYAALGFVILFCASGPVFRALELGHPEEPLAGALAVAAVLAAGAERPWLSLLLLLLAAATKPTAILAVAAAFIALPAERRGELVRRIVPGIALAALLLAAGALAIRSKTLELLDTGRAARYPSVWWQFASADPRVVFDGAVWKVLEPRLLPAWFGRVTHVLIPLMLVPAAVLQARFGRQTLSAAMGLLALLMLLRCVLDPVDNMYYHVPFIMALATWEFLDRRGLPVVTLLGSVGLWLALYGFPKLGMPQRAESIIYLAVAGILAIILVAALSPERDERLREAG